MGRFVLDASALVGYFQQEPMTARIGELLEGSQRGEHELFITVVNLGEVVYTIELRRGAQAAEDAQNFIDRSFVRSFDVDRAFALEAAKLKATRHFGYADCFAAVLAQRLGATLLTADTDFRRAEDLVAVEWLGP